MAIYEFQLRREIRRHVEASCSKMGLILAQNTIENLVTQRVIELANREVKGGPEVVVVWDDIVKKAAAMEAEGREQLTKRHISAKVVTGNEEGT